MAVEFVWPIAGATSANITSGFGWRNNPTGSGQQFHNGIDLGYRTGTPILASADGTCIANAYNIYLGYYIDIQHADNHVTRYQHNNTNILQVGSAVLSGQNIATVGATGDVTGPHLHFEIQINGVPVDPEPLLNGQPSSPTYWGNYYLTAFGPEMTANAQYILNYLVVVYGWTKEAVCGMLGNMQVESTINSGIWENLDAGNLSGGFGLVQWTPATNYITWAQNEGYTDYDQYGQIDPQLLRIKYELDNNLQWIPTSEYPISFEEFTQSTESPEYLASAFLKNYERAGVEAEETRRSNARYWYDNLETGGGVEPTKPKNKFWIYQRNINILRR